MQWKKYSHPENADIPFPLVIFEIDAADCTSFTMMRSNRILFAIKYYDNGAGKLLQSRCH